MHFTSLQITPGLLFFLVQFVSNFVFYSLLKGAELCHLKKPIKPTYGGGMRDFTIDEAKCFQGLEIRSNFLSGMERSMIVRQMLLMIKAPSPGGFIFRPISTESPFQVVVPDSSTFCQWQLY